MEARLANFSVPHLCQRGHDFYFRLQLRPALVGLLGRRELKLSLKTTDPALARMRCRLFSARFEQLIAGWGAWRA